MLASIMVGTVQLSIGKFRKLNVAQIATGTAGKATITVTSALEKLCENLGNLSV